MIRGTLKEFSLAEIIRFISQTRRTGVLEMRGPTGSGRVHFRDGAISGAESTLSREPLGRKLVRAGVLSESQLWNALNRQDKSPRRLGETLIAAGLAAPAEVDTALREQVEDSIVDVLRLEPTDFSWNAEAPHEGVVVLPAENLLIALSERMHELELIKTQIPSEKASVSMAPIPPLGVEEIRLTLDDWRVLVFLGARRTVRDLLNYSGSGQTQILRSLQRLVSVGLIEVLDPPATHDRMKSREPRETMGSSPPVAVHESGVIRLPDGGSISLVGQEVFKVAVVGSSPYGLGPATGSFIADYAGSAPIEVSVWSTSGPPTPDEPLRMDDKPIPSIPVRLLHSGELKDKDLVICLDWSDVAAAIGLGFARSELTFTLLELWALSDSPQPERTPVTRGAHDIVKRANARRINNAQHLSTLEIIETGNNQTPGAIGNQLERIERVCRRVAEVLFA